MKIFVATVILIALLLGINSVNLQASVTGPVPSDGYGPVFQAVKGSKGDAGEPGPFGPLGERGIPGVRGQKGVKGQRGLKGDAGIDGHGQIGPIGPKGDTGPKGSVGPTGLTGVKGQKGEPVETPDDSNQRVAFTVVRTSNSDTFTNQYSSLPFQATETLLPGTSFDLGTGTFTCGVPGTYVFMFSVLKYYSSSPLYVHLRKNGDAVVSGHSNDPSHYEQVSGSAVVVLQRRDTMYLTMFGRAHSDSDHYTSFSGFLLYPE